MHWDTRTTLGFSGINHLPDCAKKQQSTAVDIEILHILCCSGELT